MARMPGAVWQGEHSPRTPMSRYDACCLHTIVGHAPAHAAHFSVKADGTILQSRDTAYRSAANLNGNYRIIAIENEDHGSAFGSWNTRDGYAVPDFTAAQIEANAKILAWAHKTHGIPLQLCPNSRSTSRGLAYHRQGIDGNFGDYRYPGRVSGGEVWTEHYGKVCPGDRRIARRQQILDRAKQIVNGDDVLNSEDKEWLKRQFGKAATKGEVESLVKTYAVGDTAFKRSFPDIAKAVHADHVQVGSDTEPAGLATGRTRAGMLRVEAGQAKQLLELAAIRAAVGAEVDEVAVAQQVAALVTPAVIESLAGVAYLTPEQVETAAENAVRDVLRAGVDANGEEA